MLRRLKTLWLLSGMNIDNPKPKDKSILDKVKETLSGKRMAVIVEDSQDPLKDFENNNPNE